jgi:hypothetical protein
MHRGYENALGRGGLSSKLLIPGMDKPMSAMVIICPKALATKPDKDDGKSMEHHQSHENQTHT